FKEPDVSFFKRKEAPLPFTYRESVPLQEEKELGLFQDKLQVIGLWSPYLLLESSCLKERIALPLEEGGMCMVDLPAAKSRVLFERLLRVKDEPCHKQGLM